MFRKQECVAMLLAGGQGSRLYTLTQKIAKPAVPYGGKYRIIDFPLSNCVNSGIETVGVLTQYQPLELSDYIGSGQAWDLDVPDAGVHILPPYQQTSGADWYKGTANAIFQNMNFIERYDPEYVLILSGDHIYKMDYARMLRFHKEHEAACTVAVLSVEPEEAHRFGIVNIGDNHHIVEFEEKPEHPKSNLASMGIYIFSWAKLKTYLKADDQNPSSKNDFGHDVLPTMLAAGEPMVAYPFEGYWKDVGTIDSLWEANMDLLNPNVPLDLSDPAWRIYSNNPALPPQYIGAHANVQNSMISEGCSVYGTVDFSVLFPTVVVEEGAEVRDSILMPGVRVKKGAKVQYTILAEHVTVGENADIGERPEDKDNLDEWGVSVVGEGLCVDAGAHIPAKAMIDAKGGDTHA